MCWYGMEGEERRKARKGGRKERRKEGRKERVDRVEEMKIREKLECRVEENKRRAA